MKHVIQSEICLQTAAELSSLTSWIFKGQKRFACSVSFSEDIDHLHPCRDCSRTYMACERISSWMIQFESYHLRNQVEKTYFRFLMTNSQSKLARYKYQHQNPSLIIYSMRISISFQLLSTYRTVLHSRSCSRKNPIFQRNSFESVEFNFRFTSVIDFQLLEQRMTRSISSFLQINFIL